MNLVRPIGPKKHRQDKRHDVLRAVAAFVQMEPRAREDLIAHLTALNAAQQAGDKQEQGYVVKAIREMFEVEADQAPIDLVGWERQITKSAKGHAAAAALRIENERFFRAYQQQKARRNLNTIRAVAQAAGISPTTVHAIEKQKIKPQFKTVLALAKAFKVSPETLHGE